MAAQGEYMGNVTLRLSYGDVIGPWWSLTNILIADVPRLVEGTGWLLEDHVIGGMDHYLKLRRMSRAYRLKDLYNQGRDVLISRSNPRRFSNKACAPASSICCRK